MVILVRTGYSRMLCTSNCKIEVLQKVDLNEDMKNVVHLHLVRKPQSKY